MEQTSANPYSASPSYSGEDKTFKIVSIEPDSHRLGLSLKALEEAPKAEDKKEEKKEEETEEKPAEEKTA